MGRDIEDVVMEFFMKNNLLKSWNTTIFTLVPKIPRTNEFKNFIPISLCNCVFKIIIKLLTPRLQKHLRIIIYQEKYGFVYGR